MRAVVLREYGEPLSVEERDPPAPAAHGAVVEVEACGICRSDWHAWQGHGEWADDRVPLGQVLGHEPAGRVVATGDRVDLEVGERVAVPFCLGEGSCRHCRSGHANVCEDGHALGFEPSAPGAFAERVHVPHAEFNVARLPDDVSAVEAAALGCRYATAYHALAHRVGVGGGDRVAVLGCGGVGLSAVQVADALGATAVAVDVREGALTAARDAGAAATVEGGDDPDAVAERVREAAGGPVEASLDALGSAATARAGVASLDARGSHVQVGLTGEAERGEIALPSDEMARWERSFVGARGMPPSRYPELLRLIEAGHLDPGALVSREVDLEAVPGRLAAMTDYGTTGIEVATP